jgi:hypothetical protein
MTVRRQSLTGHDEGQAKWRPQSAFSSAVPSCRE